MNSDLIHDWNLTRVERAGQLRIEFMDETLSEGVQSTAVRTPDPQNERSLLACSIAAGFKAINLGVNAHRKTVTWVREQYPDLYTAVSTPLDILSESRESWRGPVSEVRFHLALSMPVLEAEGVGLARRLARISNAMQTLTEEGKYVVWVAEDATRTSPETLAAALKAVQDAGCKRVCLADSVGIALPMGVDRLFHFVKDKAPDLAWDWSGRNDRGFAVINALTAAQHGARICGTALGIGEGPGVIALDTLLTNVALSQDPPPDLVALKQYCFKVAEVLRVRIPVNYPVLGEDAFRTATGVHAAAIVKARKKGDVWLADRVYSGIPAALLGLSQRVDIGPMSGISNVTCWLEDRRLTYTPEDVTRILQRAKQSNRTLSEEEVLQVLKESPAAD